MKAPEASVDRISRMAAGTGNAAEVAGMNNSAIAAIESSRCMADASSFGDCVGAIQRGENTENDLRLHKSAGYNFNHVPVSPRWPLRIVGSSIGTMGAPMPTYQETPYFAAIRRAF